MFVYLFIFGWAGSSLLCGLVSSHGERGLLLIAVFGLLTEVASLVAERGMQASVVEPHGLRICGPQGLEHRLSSRGTWT